MTRIIPFVAASLCCALVVHGCSSSSNNSSAGGQDGGLDGSTADVARRDAPYYNGDDSGSDSGGCPLLPCLFFGVAETLLFLLDEFLTQVELLRGGRPA